MFKQNIYFVYIMTNPWHTTLYTGVTNDLVKRVYQHKNATEPSFTKRYHSTQLVYYEKYLNVNDAISREKQVKAGSRKKKIELIEKSNLEWRDFSDDF